MHRNSTLMKDKEWAQTSYDMHASIFAREGRTNEDVVRNAAFEKAWVIDALIKKYDRLIQENQRQVSSPITKKDRQRLRTDLGVSTAY